MWSKDAPEGNEARKILWELPKYTRGRVLDIGCGPYKAFPHFIGVDNGHHQGFGQVIKPDLAMDAQKLDLIASQSVDAIFSSHLLEHIEDYKGTLREWWRAIKPGGYLCLYLPHRNFYPNIGQDGANPTHVHDFMPEDIISAMPDGWDLVENQEHNEDDQYSFFLVFRKLNGSKNIRTCDNPKPEKTVFVVRLGAYGDNLMASSVVKGLKDAGYHVTYMGSPPGLDVLAHDPNIDAFYIVDKDQIPNQALGEFWDYTAKKFSKFVNLSESIEGTFLAIKGRSQFNWPQAVRHSMMNRNYLEFQHDLAGVPHKPQVRFYPSPAEKDWAKKERSRMGSGRVVLWSLSGSSIHKTWPYLDNIIAAFMLEMPDVHVVLCGGHECAILEQGWEKEPRVHLTSGKWSIRQTLAFAEIADMVIGPETGVLNSVSCRSMPKIVFLSHSSHENLTRDWVNTTALSPDPKDVPCYPCHQLHANSDGWKVCRKHEPTSTALCQGMIPPDFAWAAITEIFNKREAA